MYFQHEEAREVDPPDQQQQASSSSSVRRAPPHILIARLNQLVRFSLNYLTSTSTFSAQHNR
jgi:hypothetical protein